MANTDFTPCPPATAAGDFAPPPHILAFEMPDDSMYPRIRKGDFALLDECAGVEAEAGEDVLVQLDDGRRCLRTVAKCSGETMILSAYNLPSEVALSRNSIAAIYRIDMIVPPSAFALMTGKPVCWKVRDAIGNEYGAFPTRDEATAFGDAVAERLGLDEIRYRRALACSDLAKAEVTQ